MKKNVFSLIVLSCMMPIMVQAHDFASVVDGQTLYFSIIDSASHTACVTYEGGASGASQTKSYKGVVTVPVRVTVKGVTYSVTSIGTKAFCNSPGLTGIIFPGGVTGIGDFAFDGCINLESVVFPGNEVSIGEGAFFRCPSVSRVSIGSDWTNVNLRMFSWSEKLEEITIPAKVRQIRNLKSIRSLKRVNVDINNPYYISIDGLLYSADGHSLLAVPRALEGKVTVKEGTERVYKGAISDCYSLNEIVLPSSLTGLSYREFAELTELKTITFLGVQPIMTATCDGKQVFALMVASSINLSVPQIALKDYRNAIVSTRGEYADLQSNLPSGSNSDVSTIPVLVHESDMVKAGDISGDKKLNP